MSRHDAITPGRARGSTHFLVSPRPRVAAPQVRPNISEKVLADQLRQTERDGILHRASAATVPPQVTYSLNPEGRNWFP